MPASPLKFTKKKMPEHTTLCKREQLTEVMSMVLCDILCKRLSAPEDITSSDDEKDKADDSAKTGHKHKLQC